MMKLLMVHCLYSPFDFYKSPDIFFLKIQFSNQQKKREKKPVLFQCIFHCTM